MLTKTEISNNIVLDGTYPWYLEPMTTREVNKRTDKTPLGTMLSILMSFEVLSRYLELELKRYEASLIRFNIMSTLFKNGGGVRPSEISETRFRGKKSITTGLMT